MRTDVNEGSLFLPQGLFTISPACQIQSRVLPFVTLFVNCFLYIVKILASTSMSQRDMSAAETSLVQKTFKGRLKCNPMLGVADLMKAFQKLIDFHNSRDIRRILDPPADMDWKPAPHAKWICRQSVLFSALLDCAPNAVLTSRKVKEALQRLHDEGGSLNSTRKDDGILWDIIDTKIRIGMAQLRELKNNRDLCLDRARRKLSEEEQGTLQSLLDKVHFSSEDSPSCPASTTTQHQLVLASSSPPTTTAQQHEEEQKSAKHQNGKEQHPRPDTPKKSSASSSSRPALPAAPTQDDMSKLFENILSGKSTKAKKKQESQTKEDVMVTTSSEASTPDKKRQKSDMLLSTRKKLSFEDTDDEDEDPTEEDSPRKVKIKLLPKGVQIMRTKTKKKEHETSKKDKEKKRQEKERSREENRTKKKKTKTTSATGFFLDDLLHSLDQEDSEDALEPNEDVKTEGRKKDKEDKKKLSQQTAGARDRDFNDHASRFLICCGGVLWSFFDVVVECQLLRDSAGIIDCLCERCRLERVES